MAGKCPEGLTPIIKKYLGHVTTEVTEGRKYYEIEAGNSENQRKIDFFNHALVQVDLVNSILQVVKQLFDFK